MARTIVMYALFTGRHGQLVPRGIFHAKWKAESAQRLWNSSSGWKIKRIAVTISDDFVYELCAHEYKRLTPRQLVQVTDLAKAD